jgi:site-specific DNA-cytosine methylase
MQLYHLRHQVSVLAQESQTYGTVFSGTDGFGHMLEVLSEVWKELFDLVVEFKQMFACDNNPRVQEYLKSQLDKDILIFPDIVQLVAGVDAMELRSHKCQVIPHVNMIIGGITCVDRAKNNNKAAGNVNCVQNGTGDTGAAAHNILQFIKKAQPRMVLVECVVGLSQGIESDSAYMISTLDPPTLRPSCLGR